METNYGIIMAGGVGSRFWPMSTPTKPKQFLDVLGMGKSLLRMTFERMLHLAPASNIYIMTNALYADLVAEQLPELSRGQILTEPKRKNTAPCIAYAASKIAAINPDANLIISPADHLIIQEGRFKEIITKAIETAENDRLVTLGIQPTRPDTGYGYIEFSTSSAVKAGEATPVIQFREKPDLETAQTFLSSGNFYWNSGIFVWKARTVLSALAAFQPTLHDLFNPVNAPYNSENEQEFINDCFEQCEDISIDYAIMEHAKNIDVVLADFDWSDLGTWGSLKAHLPQDDQGNSILGGNVHLFNSNQCQVNVPSNKLVVVDGLTNYIIVESDNMLMILNGENEQELKNYLKQVELKSPAFFKS